jgi:hypothetical protein
VLLVTVKLAELSLAMPPPEGVESVSDAELSKKVQLVTVALVPGFALTIPAPPSTTILAEKVLRATERLPPKSLNIPPPLSAEFPAKVLLVIVSDPRLKTPPPEEEFRPELPENVLAIIEREPAASLLMPDPSKAELVENVLLLIVTIPAALSMAPPLPSTPAELSEKLLLLIVILAPSFKIAPPRTVAEFPEKAQLVIVSDKPALLIAPPGNHARFAVHFGGRGRDEMGLVVGAIFAALHDFHVLDVAIPSKDLDKVENCSSCRHIPSAMMFAPITSSRVKPAT